MATNKIISSENNFFQGLVRSRYFLSQVYLIFHQNQDILLVISEAWHDKLYSRKPNTFNEMSLRVIHRIEIQTLLDLDEFILSNDALQTFRQTRFIWKTVKLFHRAKFELTKNSRFYDKVKKLLQIDFSHWTFQSEKKSQAHFAYVYSISMDK